VLDDREQSILRDIERHLEQTDRRLVRRGRRETDRRSYWWSVAALIAGVVLGMALAALGPVGHGLLLILVSAVPMALWHWRRPGAAAPLPSGPVRERRG
jgi:fatty acid desaturase